MLTIAYCRISTEEQAEEDFSIDGQADRLRAYSTLRDLGEVTVLTDPGRSSKDILRPGLQQLLVALEAGHVRHVLVWRLDRLSRNLRDLICSRTSSVSREYHFTPSRRTSTSPWLRGAFSTTCSAPSRSTSASSSRRTCNSGAQPEPHALC